MRKTSVHDVALGLVDRHALVAYRAFVCILVAEGLEPRYSGPRPMSARDGIRSGIEHGDVLRRRVLLVVLCLHRFAAGHALADVENDAQEGLEFRAAGGLRGAGKHTSSFCANSSGRWVAAPTTLTALTGPGSRRDRPGRRLSRAIRSVTSIRARLYVHSLQAQVFGGAYAEALATSDRLAPELPRVRGLHAQADAAFFGALAIAGCDARVRRARLGTTARARRTSWRMG